MIIVFMVAIMSGRMSALIALILIPFIFAMIGGFGLEVPQMMADGLRKIAPTAVLLLFAILYFGLMIDVGLFDPLVRFIVRTCHGDPLRVVVGTTALAMAIALDGDGSTTYLLVVTAMMALHLKLGINPLILPTVSLLSVGVVNLTPWGGPTTRVMGALHLDVGQVFVPMIPAMVIGGIGTFVIATWLGLRERRRLGVIDAHTVTDADLEAQIADASRAVVKQPKSIFIFNAALTFAMMGLLVLDIMPLPIVFMIGFAIAITVNFSSLDMQRERIHAHAGSALAVVGIVFAAGSFTGIMNGTGMNEVLANSVVALIPEGAEQFLPLATAILSMPFTFFLSNDTFYFGVVPVLAQAAAEYGIPPEVIARASLVGQPVHMLSPLAPSVYVLLGLTKIEFGSLQRFAIPLTVIASLVILFGAIITGAVPLGSMF